MSRVEYRPSIPVREYLQNRKLSRKDFVRDAAMLTASAGMLVGLHEIATYLPPNIRFEDIDAYVQGNEFLTTSDEYWKHLSEPITETEITPTVHWITDRERMAEIEYTYDGDDPLTLILTHKPEDCIQRKVLIASDGSFDYVTPIMQSSVRHTNNETNILKNSGRITILNPSSSPPTQRSQIEDIRLISQKGNPLQNLVAKTTPLYAIRKNNLQNLTRDMPWFLWNTYLKNNDTLTQAQSICFNSEIGGYSWQKRERLYHRLTDMQLSYQAKIHDFLSNPCIDSQIIEEATLLGGGHSWVSYNGDFIKQHPLIQILTDNNTFSSQLQTALFFYQRPIILPPGITQHQLLIRNPEILITSLQQSIEQGEVAEKDIKALYEEYFGYLEAARHFPYMQV